MGLSSSMYTGVSGLQGHGEKMGSIGDNISNVSTVGFKSSRMHFEDFMPQDINTSAGVGQLGRGMDVGAVMTDFSQGSLESTNESTDVAIGGDGFFTVSAPGSDENQYTRAGNFRFNEDGFLVDPHGNRVQGWEVRDDTPGVADEDEVIQTDTGVEIAGVPGDIQLEDFQSPPEQTSKVDQMLNLDSRSPARSTDQTQILRGDEEEGTRGVLRIQGEDYDIELQDDDGGEEGTNASDMVLAVDTSDEGEEPDFEEEVFGYDAENDEIVYDVEEGGYKLRWDSEAEDYALWDVAENAWGIYTDIPEDVEPSEGETEYSVGFGNADLERGGRITIDYEIDDEGEEEEIEFDSADDLEFKLNEMDVVDRAIYNPEDNTMDITLKGQVVRDGDEEDVNSFGIEVDELSPKTASQYNVIPYTEAGEPFSAMFKNWDATEDEPLADARFSYQSTMNVYDENGTSYELTNYFDKVDVNDPSGNQHWEYMTTVSPAHDNREGMEDESKRGVLMTGSLTFNPGGELVGQSAFTLNDQVYEYDEEEGESNLRPGLEEGFSEDLENWTQAEFSNEGYPVFTPNFLGVEGQNDARADDAQAIAMDFGMRNLTANWDPGSAENPGQLGIVEEDDIVQVRENIPDFEDGERQAQATTQYSSSSTTLTQNQDGYTTGFLQNIEVDRNGVLTGRYDNGQVMELYALTLSDFHNEQGLRKEGGNLFSETRRSGPAFQGVAGTRGMGEISSNSLEMSNVDISTEFVKMIQTEKGFQANSKTITTTDQMLQVLMQMK